MKWPSRPPVAPRGAASVGSTDAVLVTPVNLGWSVQIPRRTCTNTPRAKPPSRRHPTVVHPWLWIWVGLTGLTAIATLVCYVTHDSDYWLQSFSATSVLFFPSLFNLAAIFGIRVFGDWMLFSGMTSTAVLLNLLWIPLGVILLTLAAIGARQHPPPLHVGLVQLAQLLAWAWPYLTVLWAVPI